MQDQNPFKESIDWLIDQGFETTEATNICGAIRAKTADKLLDDAQAWIEWCGKIKREYECIVMLAAMGMITVQIGPGGVENDLRMRLADQLRENQTNGK